MNFSNLEGLSERLGNSCFVVDSSLCYELKIIKGYIYNLKHEVLKELMTNNVNRNDFLDYIISEIEPLTVSKDHFDLLVKKLLEEYNDVTIEDIMNNKINNSQFKYLVNTNYKEIPKSYPNEDIALSLQFAFYEHISILLEHDLIEFLKSKKTSVETIIVEDSEIKKESEVDLIFKNKDAFQIFNFLLDKFAISKETSKNRGVQAKLNALWSCPSSKKVIFREHTELKDYIKYLNITYNLNYSSRTMSDGYNYHITIQNWLIEYR